ncbi:putative Glycoprotein-N-acetylgalactosamine 3-beta-galactosyltransferase 1 [Hypsibius exemplaris]|uniref:N-acetylgalactosaminide beta-1,3-galactosyltransferase n=1 Tax=Hypsibius exemplaris TaxID=2072580 RepID=A0A1W0WH55_HYPEX|nr:putative Glycoprotein-N-acetylgalactosamine 3-beta-galactosyltransferase 1 [Hypsibius exemplaris]
MKLFFWLKLQDSSQRRLLLFPLVVLIVWCLAVYIIGRIALSHNGDEKSKASKDLGRKKVRVFCMLNHKAGDEARARAVLETWLKRCDGYAFVSTRERTGSPTIVVPRNESRLILWVKVQAMLRRANTLRNEYDWFLKTDDDTYVIVENLRLFLSNHSATEAVYFGNEFSHDIPGGFLSGGAGYVLSKTAVQLIVEKGFDTGLCDLADHEVEEHRLAQCAGKVGVRQDGDTIDHLGRGRFFPYGPEKHFTPGNEDLGGWSKHRLGHHFNCCSDTAISFHYITPIYMYILDYFIYILQPSKDWTNAEKTDV